MLWRKEGSSFLKKKKPQKGVDSDTQEEEAPYVEYVEILMVDVTKGLDTKTDEVNMIDCNEQVKLVFPRAEEELIDFLNKCKLKDFEVVLFPCYKIVFDKEVAKEVEKIIPRSHQPHIFGKQGTLWKFVFDKRGIPHKVK